jgi:hypothetical protein
MDDLQQLDLLKSMRWLFSDIAAFTRISGLVLRPYQVEVARRIVDSVMNNRGDSIVLIFPRQSGKNELQAQIETFLLVTYQIEGAEMVKISPTWKPQSQNARMRLERILRRNRLTYHYWQKESGYIYRIFEARIAFLSGAPETHIVGATANRLLEVDEAQDMQIDDTTVVIAPGLTVAAKSLFSWRGVLELEARGLYGVASGSGLVLFATLRYGRGSVR